MNKVHFIINPTSAGGRTALRWREIKESIKSHFHEYQYIFTDKPLQAKEITRDLIRRGYDLIIGVGGDGTLNEILNGFFCQDSEEILNDQASLGFMASGTGSDFIRPFKIPRDLKNSLASIKNSTHKKIDVGKILYKDKNQQLQSRHFLNVADFGLGAEVVSHLSNISPAKRNSFAYYKALLLVLRKFKSKRIKIRLESFEEIEGKFIIGAVANGKNFGGGMQIAPDAQIDDGYLDLILIKEMGRIEILFNSLRLYAGTILKHPKVSCQKIKEVEFLNNQNQYLECDGELIYGDLINIKIITQALNLRI